MALPATPILLAEGPDQRGRDYSSLRTIGGVGSGHADQGDHGSEVQVSSWQASGPDGRGCLGGTRQHNYNEEECWTFSIVEKMLV